MTLEGTLDSPLVSRQVHTKEEFDLLTAAMRSEVIVRVCRSLFICVLVVGGVTLQTGN